MESRFVTPFEKAGYSITQEAKARYLHGMICAIPDMPLLEAFVFLRRDYWIRLFSSAALRKGNAYTVKELRQMAHPGDAFADFLHDLRFIVAQHILQRGYRLACDTCGLEGWYALRDAATTPCRCEGCRQPIFLPLELDFAYRLNPLFAIGFNNGALTIFLAALALQPEKYDFCAIVRKNALLTDIDLLVWRQEKMYLIECKDHLPEETALRDQLAKLAHLARDGSAQAYFATLVESIPDSIQAFADENQIQILTRRQLLNL